MRFVLRWLMRYLSRLVFSRECQYPTLDSHRTTSLRQLTTRTRIQFDSLYNACYNI